MKKLSLDEIEVQLALGLPVSGYDLEQLKRYTYGIRRVETLEAFYSRLRRVFFSGNNFHDRTYVISKVHTVIRYIACHKCCTSEMRDEIIARHFLGEKSTWPKSSWLNNIAAIFNWAKVPL